MLSLVTTLVSKLTATVSAGSDLVANATYNSRIVLSEVVQQGRLKLDYVAGFFFQLWIQLFSDSTSVTDTVSRGVGKTAPETSTVSDSTVKALTKTQSETPLVTDTVNRAAVYIRTNPETATVTDSIIRNVNKVAPETATVTDSTVRTLDKITLETTTVSDVIVRNVSYNRTHLDSTIVTDGLTTVQAHSNITQDNFVATDDYFGLATVDDDQFSSVGKTLLISTAVSDDINRTIIFNRLHSDSSAITDTTTKTVSSLVPVENIITPDNTVKNIGSLALDTLTSIDSVTRTAAFGRVSNDNLSLSDAISKTVTTNVSLEIATISDSLLIYSHTYFQGDYVQIDYSGNLLLSQAG